MRKNIITVIIILCILLYFSSIGLSEPIKIFEGHYSPISDFTITYDKNTLISLDSEGKIKFWSLNSYKVINELHLYNAPYFLSIDVSQSSRYLALSGSEILWIYDVVKKKVISKLNGVESIGLFIGDDTLLYLRDGYINMVTLDDKALSKKIRFPYTPPDFISVSPLKRFLALGSNEYLMIYDLERGKLIRKIKRDILSFSFLGDKRFIFQAKDGIYIDNINGRTPALLPIKIHSISYIEGSPYKKRFVVSTEEKLILYTIEGGKVKEEFSKEFESIQKWIYINDKKSAFLPVGANEIAVVSTPDLSAIANLGGYSLPVDKVEFSPSGRFLALGFKDKESYIIKVYDMQKTQLLESDVFSSLIDFEISKTDDRIGILSPDYELYIYNLKKNSVEKVIEEVKEELLLFRKKWLYTFFGYSNLGIYNIDDGSFDNLNLNSMPFLHPTISNNGTIATLGEDGNIWVYMRGKKNAKKIELPDDVKEKLQAEELGIDLPRVTFTEKRGEILLSIPEENGFTIEKIENFKSKKKWKAKGPIIGTIDGGRYYLQTVFDKGKTTLFILNRNFKKVKEIEIGEGLISSYTYAKGILVVGDYCGNVKFIKIKNMETLVAKVFNDGNWIIINDKGEFFGSKGIDKYLSLTKEEFDKRYKKDIMKKFFK